MFKPHKPTIPRPRWQAETIYPRQRGGAPHDACMPELLPRHIDLTLDGPICQLFPELFR